MKISIHQPAYLPWLGYMDKIIQSDIFVYLDTVQFQKNSFQNRNKILTANGPLWLSIPVLTKGKLFELSLKEIEIDSKQKWQKKHLNSIRLNYKKAICYKEIFPEISEFYQKEFRTLSDICFEMLTYYCHKLGITTQIIKSSELGFFDSQKSDLVLDICKSLSATSYLSGSLGRNYLDLPSFERENIEVKFQDYIHPTYQQVTGAEFIPYMAIIDLLMNEQEAGTIFKGME
ncbi:WbqC family protein [Terasakiella sp. SH-1]|uniref:WbqC family protein n=1 Tax=Terasakiella sp. SH-1 TaxID=2560057 RepID=UPI00107483FE|nr:WbqC family protein [Terasakiella sp. SH-1]